MDYVCGMAGTLMGCDSRIEEEEVQSGIIFERCGERLRKEWEGRGPFQAKGTRAETTQRQTQRAAKDPKPKGAIESWAEKQREDGSKKEKKRKRKGETKKK